MTSTLQQSGICTLLLCCALVSSAGAQAPETAVQDKAQSTPKPSSLLQPALDSVAHAGSAVDLNRWKGSKSLREDVDSNLVSMQKDLQTTLPPLLASADAAPDLASASLPVLLNLDALYSVLLRVAIASRNSAPRDENTALEQAAVLLDSARRDLGDAVVTAAKMQEKRTADLQAKIQEQVNAAAAAQPSSAPAATSVKARKKAAPPKASK